MQNNAVYIPSIDGKDLYISNHYDRPMENGYTLRTAAGDMNLRRFIKLRDVYERVYHRRNFSFKVGADEFTQRVINVTANYAVKAFNRIRNGLYIKNGWRYDEVAGRL